VKKLQVLLLCAAGSCECGQHVVSCIMPVTVCLPQVLWSGSSCIEVLRCCAVNRHQNGSLLQ
jgi:hypothetical protein